jgi:hypothetical protein
MSIESISEDDNERIAVLHLAYTCRAYSQLPLFKYWFPEMDDFYTTARHFLEDDTEQVTSDQMALIPWVQSIVI